ncbi:phosphoesterase family protein [Amycolatopsis echigonensis]|uniref:Phosphoesterase family protein n=1 Tax=Amycolatopsis echigonensis TaxID=2576905 RepID=A0A2N3WUT7_9PSEU|nr:alkaline phosphatase family protein [Amycolatopsis niigatensis]PKV97639.1 phosphoesterase family protein [Amycolatopsis niigatensis]
MRFRGRGGLVKFAAGVVALGAVGASLVGANSSAAASADSDGHGAKPHIGHVWTIILENKSYEATFTGLNKNDYLWKTLPSYGELLTQYYGTGHFSLDNYISLVSGQAPAPDNQADCDQYKDVAPGTPAADGQVHASSGCVYPSSVKTLFNQLDGKHLPWKIYNQDMGKDATREDAYRCGIPGDPSGAGVKDPGGATPTDQYVAKHNPAPWFRSMIDDPAACKNVVPLDGLAAAPGHPAEPGIANDLKSIDTTPAFSWISPDNCSDAHDATCKGDNLSGDPNNHQGGLYAADLFLKKYIPMIMASPAFQKDGLIQVVFDEAMPPYKMYGNSTADFPYNAGPWGPESSPVLGTDSKTGQPVAAEANTAQSVVACCNELPGPNTDQPGAQAFHQDTTPGGGITGAVMISRFIKPGSVSKQPYNHYSWLRSMEDLFGIDEGGTDHHGHLGYAAADGLRPFGGDIYNNPSGKALPPTPSGAIVYPAVAGAGATGEPVIPAGSVYAR